VKDHFNYVALDIIKRVENESNTDAYILLNTHVNSITRRRQQREQHHHHSAWSWICGSSTSASISTMATDEMNYLDLAALAENYKIFTEIDGASKVLESRWFGGTAFSFRFLMHPLTHSFCCSWAEQQHARHTNVLAALPVLVPCSPHPQLHLLRYALGIKHKIRSECTHGLLVHLVKGQSQLGYLLPL
jgi:hypothetical protein